MQLLISDTAPDFATWKQHFDTSAEDHRNAGLTLLQMWREADANRIWLLFEVANDDRARAFLDSGESKLFARNAGVTASEAHFLQTA